MKILFITDQMISGNLGGSIGAKKILQCLDYYKKNNLAEFEIISRDNYNSKYNFQIEKTKLKDIFSRMILKPNFLAIEIKKNFKKIKEYNPDVILLHNSRFGFIAKKIKKILPKVKIISFFENIEFDYCKFAVSKLAYPIESSIVKKEERKSIKYADSFVFLSINDFNRAKELYGNESKLDNNLIFPVTLNKPDNQLTLVSEKPTIIMLGTLSYKPNEESVYYFINNILSKLDASKFNFIVAGRHPSNDLIQACEKNQIKIYNGFDKLSDICPQNSCLLAPLQSGAGMKTKIAEGLSYGLYIIGSQECFVGYEAVENNDYIKKAINIEQYVLYINEFYNTYITNKEIISQTNKNIFNDNYLTTNYYSKFYELMKGKVKSNDNN